MMHGKQNVEDCMKSQIISKYHVGYQSWLARNACTFTT